MRIVIKDTKKKVTKKFLHFLIRMIQIKCLAQLNNKVRKKWDAYFEQNQEQYGTKLKLIQIVTFALNNIVVHTSDDTYVIEINPRIVMKNTNIKLSNLCRLINFGNMQVKGDLIFTRAFEETADKINIYYFTFSPALKDNEEGTR